MANGFDKKSRAPKREASLASLCAAVACHNDEIKLAAAGFPLGQKIQSGFSRHADIQKHDFNVSYAVDHFHPLPVKKPLRGKSIPPFPRQS